MNQATVSKQSGLFAVGAMLFLASIVGVCLTEQYAFFLLPFIAITGWYAWQQPGLFFWLLLASLPFSTEYAVTGALSTDFPDEGFMLLVAFLAIAQFIYKPSLLSRRIITHPLLFILVLHLGWIACTALFSTDRLVSIKMLMAKSWYIGAFVLAPLLLLRDKKELIRTGRVLLLSFTAITLIYLVRHAAYGFRFEFVNTALQPFFRNHVNYSAMLVGLLPVAWGFYKLAAAPRQKRAMQILLCILVAALVFSYARGAWLATVVAVIAWWLIRKKLVLYAWMAAMVLVIGAITWLQTDSRYLQYAHDYRTTIFHENFGEHITATYQLKDMSTAERFYRWIAGFRMIDDHPWTGTGPATFYDQYKPYAVPAFKTWVSNNPEHSTVHNYYLLTLIEQGIPGLLLFLLLCTAVLLYAQRLYHRVADPVYKMTAITAGVSFTALLTVNFLSDLVETDKAGSLFFLCIAVLVVIDSLDRRIQQTERA